jgi:hypothetical protein
MDNDGNTPPMSEQGLMHSAAAGKPTAKAIKVKVTKTGGSGNNIDCTIEPADPGSGPYVSGNRIGLPKNDGPFRIEFTLTNLEWDPDNPFTTRANNCPPVGAKANYDEQIFLQSPKDKSLTIVNLNAFDPCEVHYRMNFSDGTSCDPIMDNGGNT